HPTLRGELDRVSGEVREALREALGISDSERDIRLRRGDDLEVLLGGQRAERELHRVYDVLDRVLPQGELHTPRLDLGEIEDVVNQAEELRAAGPNVGDRL